MALNTSIFEKAIEAELERLRTEQAKKLSEPGEKLRAALLRIPTDRRYIGPMPFSVSDHVRGFDVSETASAGSNPVRIISRRVDIGDAFFAELNRALWRREYALEREHPELIDMGGES